MARYDLKLNKWEDIIGLSYARSGHSSCYLKDVVYTFSGGNEYGEFHGSIEKLVGACGPAKSLNSWTVMKLKGV